MKNKVDKLDVDKLVTVSFDLSKLSDAVKICVLNKTEYDELVKKVSAIQATDTSNLVKKLIKTQKLVKLKKKKKIQIMITNKYITIQELNKLTAENVPARLNPANLATKAHINDIVEKTF